MHFIYRCFNFAKRKAILHIAISDGLRVGLNTIFVGDHNFGTEPYLIEIGNSCLITNDVKFITHDGSIQVPLIAQGGEIKEIYSKKSIFKKIKIGNNVFLGVSSIILPGTVIGNDSIVGAGSVVNGVFLPGSVIAGNPAKLICRIEDFLEKNQTNIVTFNCNKNRKNIVSSHVDSRYFNNSENF